jgi:16S rRNA processing protein RimM
VKGEVKVLSYSGEYEHFEKFGTVSARKGGAAKTLKVEATRTVGGALLLKFAGIDTPEAAKLLADFELWVPKEKAAPLEPGEVYLADLAGCALVSGGEKKGTVTGYLEGGSAVLLEVVKTDGSTCVVPFMDVYLGDIDWNGRTIELKADWILE